MFTGIVTDVGIVESVRVLAGGKRFRISTNYLTEDLVPGASIACSGICLTIIDSSSFLSGRNVFDVEAWDETLRLTTADLWQKGTLVNLERPLKIGAEIGGHLVSGHVDEKAVLLSIEEEGEARRFVLQVPDFLAPFIAKKGSVALDGVSLTVNFVEKNIFSVLLIKHTLDVTCLSLCKIGDKLNLEVDQMVRHMIRFWEFNKN